MISRRFHFYTAQLKGKGFYSCARMEVILDDLNAKLGDLQLSYLTLKDIQSPEVLNLDLVKNVILQVSQNVF